MSGSVVVRTVEGGKYQNDVVAGKHWLVADEPADLGGTDRGPSPFEYLMAALGACTSMTIRMYADRKGWALRGVEVTLERIHLDVKEGPENEIRREIRIDGDLDAGQRQRLMDLADRCPVHRALTAGVLVKTVAA